MDKLERIKIPAVVEDEKMDIIYDALKNGGGGGGSTFDLGLTIDTDTGMITTNLTVKEIMDAFDAGKTGSSALKYPIGDRVVYIQVTPGYIGYSTDDELYLMTASFQGLESMAQLIFQGLTLNDKMYAFFGG